MSTKATWEPHTEHGKLDTSDKKKQPDIIYAFPKKHKEPLTDAAHVSDALARFDQVKDVTDEECEHAFANIKKAAEHYKVKVSENDWKELSKKK